MNDFPNETLGEDLAAEELGILPLIIAAGAQAAATPEGQDAIKSAISSLTGGKKDSYVKFVDPKGFFQKQKDAQPGIINVTPAAYAAATAPNANRNSMLKALPSFGARDGPNRANLADVYYAGQTGRLRIGTPLGPVAGAGGPAAGGSNLTTILPVAAAAAGLAWKFLL